jgi:outer membrane lipoprotein-sorting protein|tara:strand:- start:9080 stop:9643 length:564 start_codon:yes stop_codon:yes gene_type:complete
LFLKIFFIFVLFINFSNIRANEKQSIIKKLTEINNFTFSFEQITKEKVEIGSCLLVFDNKLKCNYKDKFQKEIIINNKTLVVWQKRYNKIYFYPISKSLFFNILNKNNLIRLVQKSDLILNKNIELIYLDGNKKISIFFRKKNYELIGWSVKDEFQNEIFFSLKIQKTNTQISDENFKLPSLSREQG